MLQTLRSGAAGWVAKIFLGLLVLSFAVWGIEDIFRIRGGGDNVATVGEREITVEQFRNAYTSELRRIGDQARRVITPEMARAAGVGDRVLGTMVNEAAMDASVSRLKLSLSDEEIAREIQNDEIFRGPTGSFDRVTFNELLRQNNLNEGEYVRLQRAFTARRQLTDALSGELEPPLALRQAINAFNKDSRSISYVAIPAEAPSAAPAPAADALKAFYEERKSNFRAPEFRKIAYLSLDPKALAKTMNVPDAELRAYYDANRPRYAGSEKRSIEQITFPSFDEAKAASDAIKGGKLFEQVMAERKLKPDDIYLGDLAKEQMFDKKIADAAFALQQNEVSGPVQGAYTAAILRVKGIQTQQVKEFEAVRSQIRDAVSEERARKDAQTVHDRIDEARLGGATLEEISTAQNVPVATVEAVDRNGRTPDGRELDLPLERRLLDQAFRTEVGADSETISEGDAYVWLDVRGVTPPRDRAFDEARADVETQWREEETRKRLDERVARILAEVNGGRPLEQVAAAEKLDVDQAETTRTGGAPAISAAQANAVFEAPVEGFGATGADEKGSRLVFKVTAENVRPFDHMQPDDSGQLENIAQSLANDLISAYVRKLRRDLDAQIHPDGVAKVVGGASG